MQVVGFLARYFPMDKMADWVQKGSNLEYHVDLQLKEFTRLTPPVDWCIKELGINCDDPKWFASRIPFNPSNYKFYFKDAATAVQFALMWKIKG